MSIDHQSLFESLNPSTPDKVPNSSDIVALLHLVIPSGDDLDDMTLINSYNSIEAPFMPQLPDSSVPMPPFHDATSPAGLAELIISENVQVLTEPLLHPAPSWMETPSFVGPAFSFEVPQPDHFDAHKLIELFEDTNSLQDKSKQDKRQQQQAVWKKPKGKCEVAGCNTKMQSKGKCIRHGGGRRCMVEGCTRGAQTMHRCKRHGGGARCKVEGCGTSSQGGGLCRAHGGGKLCTAPGCKKGAQRQGKCATHSSQKCRVDACSSVARCRGLCSRHKRQKLHM